MSTMFYAADTLEMPFHCAGSRAQGRAEKEFDFGAFTGPLEVRAYSDILGITESSFFVSLSPRLWIYLISRHSAGTAYVFDGLAAGIDPDNAHRYGAVSTGGFSILHTLRKLHRAQSIKAIFSYKGVDEIWKKLSPAQMAKELPSLI